MGHPSPNVQYRKSEMSYTPLHPNFGVQDESIGNVGRNAVK